MVTSTNLQISNHTQIDWGYKFLQKSGQPNTQASMTDASVRDLKVAK